MSEKKRDIKMPPSLVWREIRMRVLPGVAFLCALVAAFYFWNQAVIGPTMVGEVEAVQTPVRTTENGNVTNLLVRPFQLVKAGEPLCEIDLSDIRVYNSQLQELRGRISLSQLEFEATTDRERLAFDYWNLSMNTLRFRADLAAAKAQLPSVEDLVLRNEKGMKEQVISVDIYQSSLRQRDALRAQIAELERLVTEAEGQLKVAAATAGVFTNYSIGQDLPEAMKVLELERKKLEIRREPTILRAPIDGMVGQIVRQSGEVVRDGDTVLTVHALVGRRILTYVRQGAEAPLKGSKVTVRCRSRKREEAVSNVEEIGFRYEPITNHALIRPGVPFEMGMPVAVQMPPTLATVLRPGEVVDLTFEH
jgi:multidrug resistance efflux pump